MMRMISNYVSKPAGRGEFSLVSAHAMRIYTDAQLLRSLGQAAKQTDKTVRDFLEQERNMLFDAASNLSADAGRLLNSRRIALTPETLMKYADVLDKKLPKRVREEVVRLLEEGKIKEAEAKLKVPSLQDYIRELYAANLLFSPKTQSVNFGSQTLWLGWQFPHRALVGAVDKGLRSHFMTKLFPQLMGKHQQVFMSEIVPMFAGMKNRNSIIWKAIKERGIMNPDVFGHDITLIEDELGKAWSAWEHAPNPFVRSVGRVLTLPLKIMKTVDLYFKSLAYSAQMEVIAEREFRLHKIPHDQTMQNPTVAQEAEAAEFARYATFMDRPDAITRAMVHIRNKGAWPVMPFIITISNLLKRGIEMTPGVGLVTTGGRSPAEVIAKQIEGAFITLIISAMFFGGDEEDDRITGSQPTNPAERAAFYAQGKIPFAVRFGDRWVSYQRAEPFSLPLAMIANLREKFRRQDREMVLMPPNENDGEVLNRRVNSILDDFGTVATTVVSSVLESSYLDFVDSATRQKGWWREEVKRIPTNMVPGAALWRSLRHVMEPIREEGIASAFYGSRTLRESMDWLDQWAQVIPFGAFLYDESPGRFKLDRFGETIEVTDGALLQWLPFKTSPASWDYTELELARLHRTVGMPYPDYPDRHIQFMGQKVDIGGDIFYEYAALYGAVTKKALVAAMRRPGYRGMSDGRKKEMLEKAVARARRGAAARLRRVLRGEYRSNRIVSSGP